MQNIFVYGSLMFEPVWQTLLRGRYEKHPATLADYRRSKMRGATYPGLRQCTGSNVEGVLVLRLSDSALAILDRFEGRDYQRQSVVVTTQDGLQVRCDVYLTRQEYQHLLSSSPWDAEEFQSFHLRRFLSGYR